MTDEVKYCAVDAQHLPDYKTEGSAGWDLRANSEYEIAPHTTVKINTGLKIALPEGYAYIIEPRSSILPSKGLLVNFWLIDSDYRWEIKVVVHNLTNETVFVDYWERIAQWVIIATPKPTGDILHPDNFESFEEQFPSERWTWGFWSTWNF